MIEPFGTWVAKQGTKKAFTMVSDYGPGHDAEAAFVRSFKEAGGEIVGQLRMPIASPDFSAFVQRAKDANPESIFVFVPAGVQPAAIMKSMAERGVTPDKIKILGQGEITDDTALASAGDAALGVITSYHYDHNHNSAVNKDFVKGYRELSGNVNPNLFAVGGYDGMNLIFRGVEEDRRQGRRRCLHGGRKRHVLGKPARSDVDRSANPRRRADGLFPAGGKIARTGS